MFIGSALRAVADAEMTLMDTWQMAHSKAKAVTAFATCKDAGHMGGESSSQMIPHFCVTLSLSGEKAPFLIKTPFSNLT